MTLEIRPIAPPDEIDRCARLMATSEPWITLRRGLEEFGGARPQGFRHAPAR